MSVQFRPSETFRGALDRARLDLQALMRISEQEMAQRRDRVGDRVRTMMRTAEGMEDCFSDSDANVRPVAVCMTMSEVALDERIAAMCLRLAFHDPDPLVRGAALQSLRRLLCYIDDPTQFLSNLMMAIHFPTDDVGLIAEGKGLLDSAQALAERELETLLGELAGDQLPRMLGSRESTERQLQTSDPRLREAALLLLALYWRERRGLRAICERVLVDDDDLNVRVRAVDVLSGVYARSDEPRIGKLLARLACEHGSPLRLRKAAYIGLLLLRGMPPSSWVKISLGEAAFPECMDMDFVRSFLT